MKINMKNNVQFVLLLILLLTVCSVWESNAQLPPFFNDQVDDSTPAAPINSLVGIALVIGAYFGARKLKQKEK